VDDLSGEREIFVSVDIEASGPTPSTGSLVAIGACLVEDPARGFYREVRPLPDRPWDPAAERIHRLRRDELEDRGTDPQQAMADFAAWLAEVAGDAQPVFIGFNAPFDWMFVADYLHRHIGHNPFGISALDLKSLYMGRDGVARWAETTKRAVLARYRTEQRNTHHALDDARAQAELARLLLAPRPAAGV
jgi:DNA polymerase III epsilon subunit-like protein